MILILTILVVLIFIILYIHKDSMNNITTRLEVLEGKKEKETDNLG